MTLKKNSSISTAFKSSALIEVGDSLLTVRPLTRLTLEELSAEAKSAQVNLNLRGGRVRAQVNPPAGGKIEFTVRSPVATASVRGTEFEFDSTNLQVISGTVGLQAQNGASVAVSGGESSSIESNGRASSPVSDASSGLIPSMPVGAAAAGGSLTAPAASAPPKPPVSVPAKPPIGVNPVLPDAPPPGGGGGISVTPQF